MITEMMNRSFVYFVFTLFLTVDSRMHINVPGWCFKTDVSIPEKSDNLLQFLNMALRPTRHNTHASVRFTLCVHTYTHAHLHTNAFKL